MSVERKCVARTLVRVLAVGMVLAPLGTLGCAVKSPPPPETPATATVPDEWVVESRAQQAATTAATNWVASFGDPQLDLVVAEAIANNLNLRVAAASLEIAEQIARKAGAPLYPWVSLSANAAGLGGFEAGTATNQSGISLDVFWEVDLWGRIRAGRAAAGADYRAATADYEFAALSLAGQAAKAWFQTVEFKQQVRLSEEAVALYRRNLHLAQVRFDSGLVSELDTHLAESQLASEEETLRQVRSAYQEGTRSLEIVLGRYPAAELQVVDALVAVPPPVEAGIPAQVLERRPDLVAAEQRLASAFHSIQVAEAARLPSIALTGSVGGASSDLREVLSAPNPFWTVAAGLFAPIFQAGNLQANVEIANAEQEAAVAQYGQAALLAFGEVETALAKEDYLREALEFQRLVVSESSVAVRQVAIQYDVGLIDFLSVIQIQSGYVNAQRWLLSLENTRLANRINLHLALGGDYDAAAAGRAVTDTDSDKGAGVDRPDER